MSAILWMRSREVVLSESHSADRVVGHSAGWADAMQGATQVAPTEATVLLQGESGTGMELMARLIHARSPRANRPFLAINCAALPENLHESEPFGYENKSLAAKRLGITRSQLYERLRKYNLETPASSFDDNAGLMPAV